MPPKPQQQRKPPSVPPDSLSPTSDPLPDDLRREEQGAEPADLPQSTDEMAEDDPVGAHALAPDGGAPDHPTHDDDPSEDFTPDDYEEQIEQVADGRRARQKRPAADES